MLLQSLRRLLRCLQIVPRRLKNYLPSMASGKLDTPHFRALLTPELRRLESLFRSNGYSFRLVGGVVRDLLLEQPAKDIDIATECTPNDMITLFEQNGIRYIPTGLQHGTVTVHLNSTDYEITTLRIDRETDGRHATVDFTKDWRLDALRRDLTINAMSLELDGTLYDYFDGQRHLAERKVAFVGDAHSRIREDYLRCGTGRFVLKRVCIMISVYCRILRYFRFYGRIVPAAENHDPATLDAIRETAGGLRGVSVERVWVEMGKILTGNHAPHLVRVMYQLGVAENIGTA